MGEKYYLFSSGRLINNGNILKNIKLNNEEREVNLDEIKDIYIIGKVKIQGACIEYLKKLKISIHYFNSYGYYRGSIYSKRNSSSDILLVKQAQNLLNEKKRIKIIKEITKGMSNNLLKNINYYKYKGRDLKMELMELKFLNEKIDMCENIQELIWIEKSIRGSYYKCWSKIFNQDIYCVKKEKKLSTESVNALTSFVNSLMYTTIFSEISKTDLNCIMNYLHSVGERHFSSYLDISQIFRPLIADKLIFLLINKGIIKKEDFQKKDDFCYIKESAREKIICEYIKKIEKPLKNKKITKDINYRKLVNIECFKIIEFLNGNKDYKAFKI